MSEKITFKELVELISRQSNQSQSSANSFIHELVQIIEGGLKKSGSVSISGFGKFELRWMNERPGTNPQTGEEITIPGQNKVVFKPYKALREDVNKPFASLKSTLVGGADAKSAENESDTDSENQNDDAKDSANEIGIPFIAAKAKEVHRTSVPIDELLIEHDNPHFPEASTLTESDEDSAAIIPPIMPNEEKVAEEVQKAGTFKWSYAAAVIIALIAFIILFFMFQRMGDTGEPVTADQTEQLLTPVSPDDVSTATDAADDPEPPPPEPQTEFQTENYTVEPGESLWTIAESRLGNPYLWPLIYQLNGNIITNPNQLPAVADLDIPVISSPENLNEFEREQVALGYFALYEWNRENNPDEARFFLWAVGVFSPEILDEPPSEVDPDDLAFALNR
ncbi:MAG: HU family DNA-binding protein [Balneolaceae bacterium]|nr:HU family DNA-binding protein [Balneolaceae bacterium]